MELWFTEKYSPNSGITIKVKQELAHVKSKYQEMSVIDTYEFGKIMVLDGFIMFTDKDEFIYHEMITHVPLFSHENPENVLLIGGGDGGAVREVLKHNSVRSVELVEIDKMVVDASKEFFPQVSVGFSDKRFKLHIEDGIKFVKESKDKYDVVIVDSTDPIGPAVGLYQRDFYKNIYDILNDDGILVVQGESPYYTDTKKAFVNLNRELKAVFPFTRPYFAFIPTYPSGMWSLAYARKDGKEIKGPIRKKDFDTKYYNEEIHKASFAHPEFVKELLK
ncbi:MAG: polyamine aminopropyltransferase [Proteobacteria bacterium]|nr:polyamine aminopropyltransferase [Pseudomonadota bacterium]